MCIDLDLFGQVIITFSDVELWIKKVSPLNDDSLPNRVQHYIKDYDVARKIEQAKLSGEFYRLKNDEKPAWDINLIKSVFRAYVRPKENKPEPCPAYFHRCTNPLCPVFQANKPKTYSRQKHQAKKAERKQWLADMTAKLAVNA